MFIDAEVLQHRLDQADDGTIAVIGILTTLQNTSAASLQTKREHIERHIRTCFIDDANNAKRYTHTFEVESIRQSRMFQHLAQWRRQGSHIACISSDALDAFLRQFQTIVHRVGMIHATKVFGIGSQNGIGFLNGLISHSQQHLVDGVVVEQCKVDACVLGQIEGLKN